MSRARTDRPPDDLSPEERRVWLHVVRSIKRRGDWEPAFGYIVRAYAAVTVRANGAHAAGDPDLHAEGLALQYARMLDLRPPPRRDIVARGHR